MNTQKAALLLVLTASFFFLPKFAFTPNAYTNMNWWNNILFPISHANIYHLAANTLCLWLMKIRLRLPLTLAISFVCSLLPQWSIWGAEPILGFSGVIFAAVGIVYGRMNMFRDMLGRCLMPVIICGLFPHVALTFHAYALFIGYWAGTHIKHKPY